MTLRISRAALTQEIARAVRDVPGVAFLRPGLADLLRAAPASADTGGAHSGAGVRVRGGGGAPWHVEVRLVALSENRTVDVARAARRAVEALLDGLAAQEAARAHVSVTVTGRL
ncbi:hypothetical protein ACGFYZ_20370 [Streptomyces sp. NPDC048330]|uniref:hypothetical protein n=1 Tax=Streptomyces sp. NPDC048330 TaxID=3365533 RepID=UPI0037141F28